MGGVGLDCRQSPFACVFDLSQPARFVVGISDQKHDWLACDIKFIQRQPNGFKECESFSAVFVGFSVNGLDLNALPKCHDTDYLVH